MIEQWGSDIAADNHVFGIGVERARTPARSRDLVFSLKAILEIAGDKSNDGDRLVVFPIPARQHVSPRQLRKLGGSCLQPALRICSHMRGLITP
jgi:hypothetical protein